MKLNVTIIVEAEDEKHGDTVHVERHYGGALNSTTLELATVTKSGAILVGSEITCSWPDVVSVDDLLKLIAQNPLRVMHEA